jgi:hypothetical protein
MKKIILSLFVLIAFANFAAAQTTAFTYQGKLTDGGGAPTGQYDFTFRIFSTAAGGSPIAEVTVDDVQVTAGIFTAQLDFGNAPFPVNALRWMEIAVRPGASSGAYTTLAPRQPIGTTPYAMNSIGSLFADTAINSATAANALNLGGVAANQFVLTGDARLSDARNPLPNSPNYIQNTTSPQSSSNFNISGNGTAGGTLSGNIISATTQFNLGGNRILSMNPAVGNLYGGLTSNSSPDGGANTVFGVSAGTSSGFRNAVFGNLAGNINSTGSNNSLFGAQAGQFLTSGDGNSFFGYSAGGQTTTACCNSFFGSGAGQLNVNGQLNSFFGGGAGFNNTSGVNNTFIGNGAGAANTVGSNNTLLGYNANVLSNDLTFATAIGAGATINRNNQIVLGRSGGQDDVVIHGNTNISRDLTANIVATQQVLAGASIGINTTAPTERLHVVGNGLITGDLVVNGNISGNLPPGSGNYIQNTTSSQIANFNINGFGFIRQKLAIGTSFVSAFKLFILDSGINALRVETEGAGGRVASFGGNGDFLVDASGVEGGRFIVKENGNVGVGISTPNDKLEVNGVLRVNSLGTFGISQLCRNVSNQISVCSSSLRYKTNIAPFKSGLSFLKQLRPITFEWKEGGSQDIGFGAEDVAKINPLFVNRNERGEIEGVKYDRLSAVFVNAFLEQQAQIQEQQKQIETQQRQIDVLKNLVCELKPEAAICKEEQK